jgi:hypothetical protein
MAANTSRVRFVINLCDEGVKVAHDDDDDDDFPITANARHSLPSPPPKSPRK